MCVCGVCVHVRERECVVCMCVCTRVWYVCGVYVCVKDGLNFEVPELYKVSIS